ncbi:MULTISPECIES: SsgA family sporulation/cell division regulator [unclassified Streptomyces]|uniref:SsgA family sporulation/cell division regulator n=1 Tax=unclassified Streptomyces TaxID=2593676 RepID=UPI0022B692A1|nr:MULTISPECIES: SsgA family sporulation/cell division regulator [unclassified Streptomyces]MCZ7414745.1 SsgA family sporulation/cell division regulator [Streptomyces sp. WMMC897]MCZ7431668.1 SsgA family sporulation/cell division regulator [Streptomyces sp. WMMC1477]
MRRPLTIDHTVRVRLPGRPGSGPVPATLHYDGADPLALRVTFPAEASLSGTEVTWVFARRLLDDGLCGPAGEGDVRIRPGRVGRTVLELCAPQGTALVELRREDLHRFLAATYTFVPEAAESSRIDVDAALAALLGPV